MKNIFLYIFLLGAILNSDFIFAQRKISKKERTQAAVATQMLNRDLTIYITNVISELGIQSYPQGVKVTLKDNKFNCNLPYQGDASINTYGTNDLSIVCDNNEVEVKSEYVERKKYYQLNFEFESKFDNEKFDVDLKVFTNGKVVISIYSAKRSVIRYTGGLWIMI